MSDSTNIQPYAGGDGIPIATDLVTINGSQVRVQRAKMTYGDDNSSTDVSEANPLPVEDVRSGNVLLRILQMLMAPLGYDKSLGRQRGTVIVESGSLSAVSTVNTVSSVSNIVSVGSYPAQMQIIDANRAAWALGVRSRIT